MKKRVSFFIARYSISGVPLAQIRLAKAFYRKGHQVDIVIGYVEGLALPVIEGIPVTYFNLPRTHEMLMPIITHVRKSKPDVVFSAEDHLNAIVAIALILARSKAKLSVSSRVNPYDTYPNKLFSKGTILKLLMKVVVRRADVLTCVSKDMVDQYRTIFNHPPHIDVYNIIDNATARKRMLEPVDEPWLLDDSIPVVVAAGGLGVWKGFDTLIDAVKELLKIRKVRLLILGEGRCRGALEKQIAQNGLTDWVKLPGYVENPLKYFRNADVFALSSRLEGMPNVLVEAMICGCTPVATDCPTGPREVLQNGKYGYLVPVNDPVKMAEAINKALDCPISSDILAEAVKPFAEDLVYQRHIDLLGLNALRDKSDCLKICVAVSAFSPTGVPLAQLRFARALAEKGHEIDFLVGGIGANFPDTTYPVVNGVNVIPLNQTKIRHMFFPVCAYLRKTKPDVVFSAEDHFNGLFLLAAIASGSKAKISGSSRVPPSDSYSNTLFSKRWVKKLLMRAVMWRADVLTCVSKDMVDDYRYYFGNSTPHVGVYNIIVDEQSLLRRQEPLDDPWFNDRSTPLLVAAGTLTTRKGFADLIQAMHELVKTRKARLVILGEGPLRGELQALIDALGLSEFVRLYGLVNNPLKYYARSDIFVLSSYAEGLPNVLVEAMMCGCTPVATDCRTGPREVIAGGKYGYLAPVGNPEALAGAIAAAIDRPIPAHMLLEAIEPFREDAVIQRHFELLGLSEYMPTVLN